MRSRRPASPAVVCISTSSSFEDAQFAPITETRIGLFTTSAGSRGSPFVKRRAGNLHQKEPSRAPITGIVRQHLLIHPPRGSTSTSLDPRGLFIKTRQPGSESRRTLESNLHRREILHLAFWQIFFSSSNLLNNGCRTVRVFFGRFSAPPYLSLHEPPSTIGKTTRVSSFFRLELSFRPKRVLA